MVLLQLSNMIKSTLVLGFLCFSAMVGYAQKDTIYTDHVTVYREGEAISSVFLFAVCNSRDRAMYDQLVSTLRKKFTTAKIRCITGLMDEAQGLDSLFSWTDRVRASPATTAVTINKMYPASTMSNLYASDTTGRIMNIAITNNEKDDGGTIASISFYINGATTTSTGNKAAQLLLDILAGHGLLPAAQ